MRLQPLRFNIVSLLLLVLELAWTSANAQDRPIEIVPNIPHTGWGVSSVAFS